MGLGVAPIEENGGTGESPSNEELNIGDYVPRSKVRDPLLQLFIMVSRFMQSWFSSNENSLIQKYRLKTYSIAFFQRAIYFASSLEQTTQTRSMLLQMLNSIAVLRITLYIVIIFNFNINSSFKT